MKDYYVVLTGAIDNAGDFLIRDRALRLLQRYRPDRAIVEWSRREAFDDERIGSVNGAKALILAGGPSVQPNMYPGVFPLADLLQIQAPVILFGAGWKGGGGSWQHENTYRLTDGSKKLMAKLAEHDYSHGVRDYHTLRVLRRHGVPNVSVAGCPALYGAFSEGADRVPFEPPVSLTKITVSAGVKFVHDKRLESQFVDLLLRLRRRFPGASLTVVFHHSLSSERRKEAYGKTGHDFIETHEQLIDRIKAVTDATTIEVGSDLEGMMQTYSESDLHVGYRVHAHAYMSSIGKPTYLLAEDGRGTGMEQLTGVSRVAVATETITERSRVRRLLDKVSRRHRSHVEPHAIDKVLWAVEADQSSG